jgi:hypothetical protein
MYACNLVPFSSVSPVFSLRETIARKKREKETKRTSNVLARRNRKKNSSALLNTDLLAIMFDDSNS